MEEKLIEQQLATLEEKNERLAQQLYILAKYLAGDPDLDFDVCQQQTKQEICPYRNPPYGDKDERVCVSCVIRVLCGTKAVDNGREE